MRTSLLFILSCLTTLGSESIASVIIVNPKAVLPASRVIHPRRYPEFSARLSPNGKHILFPQQMMDKDETYRLVLLEIDSETETEIPIDLPSGYETVFTRFNFFNPTGDKLALFSMKQYPNPSVTEIEIYDIPSHTLTTTNIIGNHFMAQFDSTGQNLVVSQHNSYVALASIEDFLIGRPLLSGWAHSCSPFSPYAAIFQTPNPRQNTVGFKLLDLTSKKATPLPVHENNSRLDDVTSQWNLDGRYVFYFDILPVSNDQLAPIIRVWDVHENQEKTLLNNVTCLGPGPTANLMMMASLEEDFRGNVRLYDIESYTLSSVGPSSIKAIHAWIDRIVYVENENGSESIFVADIVDTSKSDSMNSDIK